MGLTSVLCVPTSCWWLQTKTECYRTPSDSHADMSSMNSASEAGALLARNRPALTATRKSTWNECFQRPGRNLTWCMASCLTGCVGWSAGNQWSCFSCKASTGPLALSDVIGRPYWDPRGFVLSWDSFLLQTRTASTLPPPIWGTKVDFWGGHYSPQKPRALRPWLLCMSVI